MSHAVDHVLGLNVGDLAYEIADERVTLTKAHTPVQDDPFATFDEWDSDADRRASTLLPHRTRAR